MTNTPHNRAKSGKLFLGIILIVLGCIFMLDRLGAHLPHWVISWPTAFILLGLYLGTRTQFRKPAPIILIVLGALFLADDIIPHLNFSDFAWPVILICIGGFLITGRNKKGWKEQWRQTADNFNWNTRDGVPADPITGDEPLSAPEPGFTSSSGGSSGMHGEDYIDSVSIFGGVKKNVTSKSFRGGEIVNFMGGAEINLTQADFTGKIVLEVTQIFGGTKIIVPPHWQIHSEVAAIFGGVEDRRPLQPDTINHDKELTIKGTSIFGGIDIRSF